MSEIKNDEEKDILFELIEKNFIIKDSQDEKIEEFEMMPSRRALKGEKDPQIIFNLISKVSNKDHWYDVKSRPIFDENDKVQLAVTITIDINDSREIEKRKDEFISIASHELKTPLTTVKAFTQILLQKYRKLNDKESSGYLEKMDKQVNRLTHIVSDLLDISKIEAGKLKLSKEAFNLGDLIQDVIDNLKIINSTHNITLLDKGYIRVNADKGRIEQVIINLINNAIKYSPTAKNVNVKININKNEVVISVEDFGIGIDRDEQLKIFERFYIGEGTQRNRFFGLGLGLYISSEIIIMHKGKIWVQSQLGKGSIFNFSLPLEENN